MTITTNTKIFSHQGYVGIKSVPFSKKNESHPFMAHVIELSKVDITVDAFNIIRQMPVAEDSITDLMMWHLEGDIMFSYVAGTMPFFNPQYSKINKFFDMNALESQITEVEVPEDFKKFVDVVIESRQ